MKIIQADIAALTGHDLLEQVGMVRGQLDILSGGPPCQGFSCANTKRSIKDPRSTLMSHFIRLVKEIQPRYFVMENVPGLFYFRNFFRLILKSLEKCGYVVRFILLDCGSYGVPQTRIRVITEGARRDLNIIPAFPSPTHFEPDDIEPDKTADNNGIPRASVAVKCFATHGFDRGEVMDVWFNKRLNIAMNRKKAPKQIEQAVRDIILESLCRRTRRRRV